MNRLLAELRASARLRIALAIIAVILGWSMLLDARDGLDAKRTAYRQAANQAARLADRSDWEQWPDRLAQVSTARVRAESALWRFRSAGLAQASLQDWLMHSLRRHKVNQPNVVLVENTALEKSVELPADIIESRFKVELTADAVALQALLADWTSNPQSWWAESLNLKRQGNLYRVEALLVTGVMIEADKAEKEGAMP